MMTATLETLKRFIEHAPPATKSAVAGWHCGTEQEGREAICGECAGRIMDRGCQLPRPAEPIWPRKAIEQCCICGKEF